MDQSPKTKPQPNATAGNDGPLSLTPILGFDQLTPASQPLEPPCVAWPQSGKVEIGFKAGKTEPAPGIPFPENVQPVGPVLLPFAIEMAEGYLELVTGPAVKLGVDSRTRREFARKSLRLARNTGVCGQNAKHEARRQMVMGQSLRLLRRYQAAARAFREASKHRPTRVEALMALGWCQKRFGRSDQAVATLTRALAIAPEDPRLHYNLACYLALSSQYRAAVYELAWALELEPTLRRRAISEPDFDQLRSAPAFVALTHSRNQAK